MEERLTESKKFKLDLQLFGNPDGGDGGTGDTGPAGDDTPPAGNEQTEPKQPAEPKQPVENVVKKSQYDKVAKEVADLKRRLKARETEEETKVREQQEIEQTISELEKFKKKATLEKSLFSVGLEPEATELISETIIDGDVEEIAKVIGSTFTAKISALQKEIDALKLSGIDKPNGQTGTTGETTIEDFRKMTIDEKIALKNNNPDLFNTLNKQI